MSFAIASIFTFDFHYLDEQCSVVWRPSGDKKGTQLTVAQYGVCSECSRENQMRRFTVCQWKCFGFFSQTLVSANASFCDINIRIHFVSWDRNRQMILICPQRVYFIRNYPDSKVHGANMEPTDGPHVGPMNLAIRIILRYRVGVYQLKETH